MVKLTQRVFKIRYLFKIGTAILLLGRIAVTNLNSILKNKDVTLLTKVHMVKVTVSVVVT